MREYGYLAGYRFPGASYTLPDYVSWLWSDIAQLEPTPQLSHPALAYLVALRGTGMSIQEIFDLMDAAADSGVVFGEFHVEYHGTVRPGIAYDCAAEVISVERKHGRRAGVFDKLSFRVDVRAPGAEAPVLVCTNAWIFPRAQAS